MKNNTLDLHLEEGDVQFKFVDIDPGMETRRKFASWFVTKLLLRCPPLMQAIPAQGDAVPADPSATLTSGDGWAFRGGVVVECDEAARVVRFDDGTCTYVPRFKPSLSRLCVRLNDVMLDRQTLISSIVTSLTSFASCAFATLVIAPHIWPDSATSPMSLIDSIVFIVCFATISIPIGLYVLATFHMILRSIASVWILDRFAQIYVELTRTASIPPRSALEFMRSVRERSSKTEIATTMVHVA